MANRACFLVALLLVAASAKPHATPKHAKLHAPAPQKQSSLFLQVSKLELDILQLGSVPGRQLEEMEKSDPAEIETLLKRFGDDDEENAGLMPEVLRLTTKENGWGIAQTILKDLDGEADIMTDFRYFISEADVDEIGTQYENVMAQWEVMYEEGEAVLEVTGKKYDREAAAGYLPYRFWQTVELSLEGGGGIALPDADSDFVSTQLLSIVMTKDTPAQKMERLIEMDLGNHIVEFATLMAIVQQQAAKAQDQIDTNGMILTDTQEVILDFYLHCSEAEGDGYTGYKTTAAKSLVDVFHTWFDAMDQEEEIECMSPAALAYAASLLQSME